MLAVITKSAGIAYFPFLKNACTPLKQLYYFIENGRYLKFRSNGLRFHIHGFHKTPSFNFFPYERAKNSWRITVVRDLTKRALCLIEPCAASSGID